MKEEILKALKSIENVKVLKGPEKKKREDTQTKEGGHSEDDEYYECILLINGQLLPVTFYKVDDIREKLAEACKKWKISFMP